LQNTLAASDVGAKSGASSFVKAQVVGNTLGSPPLNNSPSTPPKVNPTIPTRTPSKVNPGNANPPPPKVVPVTPVSPP
jgi:hypothetical protein